MKNTKRKKNQTVINWERNSHIKRIEGNAEILIDERSIFSPTEKSRLNIATKIYSLLPKRKKQFRELDNICLYDSEFLCKIFTRTYKILPDSERIGDNISPTESIAIINQCE